jgi:hypothetical protein
LVEASRDTVRQFDWSQLYANAEVDGQRLYDILEREIAAELNESLKRTLGGDFFCGPAYVYDGDADGTFECPPIEVTVQRVVPTNTSLIENQETIQVNREAEKVIQSEQAKELAEQKRQQAVGIATAEREKEVGVAQAKSRQATETAAADAQAAINRANAAAQQAGVPAAKAKAEADAALCVALAQVGIRCDLLKAAETGSFPRVVSDGAIITDTTGPQ